METRLQQMLMCAVCRLDRQTLTCRHQMWSLLLFKLRLARETAWKLPKHIMDCLSMFRWKQFTNMWILKFVNFSQQPEIQIELVMNHCSTQAFHESKLSLQQTETQRDRKCKWTASVDAWIDMISCLWWQTDRIAAVISHIFMCSKLNCTAFKEAASSFALNAFAF